MIHPTAIVDPQAQIGEGVTVGPQAIIDGPAVIGDGTEIMAQAYITGYTRIGKNCRVCVGAVLGTDPQDFKFSSVTPTYLEIGDGNIIREYVTIHRATRENEATKIGNDNLIMVQSHIAHDCVIGNNNIIANQALMAGEVQLGDNVFISGGVPIHQFVRIGSYAMLSGWCAISMDVPPFMIAQGANNVKAVNVVGLKRAGFEDVEIKKIRKAFKVLYRSEHSTSDAVEALREQANNSKSVHSLIEFIESSKRGICKHNRRAAL